MSRKNRHLSVFYPATMPSCVHLCAVYYIWVSVHVSEAYSNSPPTNVVAAPAPGGAFITFANAVDADESILLTTVTARPGGQSASTAGNSVFVDGLTNGQEYTFVAAHAYKNGEISGFSAASNTIVPQNPFAPEIVDAVGGNLLVSVSWTQREGLGSDRRGAFCRGRGPLCVRPFGRGDSA